MVSFGLLGYVVFSRNRRLDGCTPRFRHARVFKKKKKTILRFLNNGLFVYTPALHATNQSLTVKLRIRPIGKDWKYPERTWTRSVRNGKNRRERARESAVKRSPRRSAREHAVALGIENLFSASAGWK